MKLACETPEKFIKILQKYKNVDPSYNKCKNGSLSYGCKLNL
jgi:hypothetical protein